MPWSEVNRLAISRSPEPRAASGFSASSTCPSVRNGDRGSFHAPACDRRASSCRHFTMSFACFTLWTDPRRNVSNTISDSRLALGETMPDRIRVKLINGDCVNLEIGKGQFFVNDADDRQANEYP